MEDIDDIYADLSEEDKFNVQLDILVYGSAIIEGAGPSAKHISHVAATKVDPINLTIVTVRSTNPAATYYKQVEDARKHVLSKNKGPVVKPRPLRE